MAHPDFQLPPNCFLPPDLAPPKFPKIDSFSPRHSRTCRLCHRQFPSGRALGGHMRVHGSSADHSIAPAHPSHNHSHQQLLIVANPSCPIAHRNSSHKDHTVSPSMELLRRGSELPKLSQHSIAKQFPLEAHKPASFSSENTDSDATDYDSEDEIMQVSLLPSSSGCKEQLSPSSLEFNSNQESHEFVDDGMMMVSSDGKKNPLYELRRNPKRSRRVTDQEFALANTAIAFAAKRSGSASPERSRPCSECGKVFWSWKALFGHMRCHPEREWRGIQPPESSCAELERGRIIKKSSAEHSFADNSELEIESDMENKQRQEKQTTFKIPEEEETSTMKGGLEARKEQEIFTEIDCMIVKEGRKQASDSGFREIIDDWTPPWPTGKRSKRRRPRSTGVEMNSTKQEPVLTSDIISMELEAEEEDLEIANCLLMLASSGRKLEEFVDRNGMESTEESTFSDSRNLRDIEEDFGQDLEVDDEEEEEEEENYANYDGGDDARDLENNIVAANSSIKYECSTCKRCFNSHQALGGHRASHRKMKGCFARTNLSEELLHESGGEDNPKEDEDFITSQVSSQEIIMHNQLSLALQEEKAIMDVKLFAKKNLKNHKCSICHRLFPSGQALGGHKRCHWTGDKNVDTLSVISTSKLPSLQSGGQPKKIRQDAIDLNLPAPIDEEEDDATYDTTELATVYGKLMDASKGKEIMGSVIEYPRRKSLNGLSGNWNVKDLCGGSLWNQVQV